MEKEKWVRIKESRTSYQHSFLLLANTFPLFSWLGAGVAGLAEAQPEPCTVAVGGDLQSPGSRPLHSLQLLPLCHTESTSFRPIVIL